jgi:hypothetical protein
LWRPHEAEYNRSKEPFPVQLRWVLRVLHHHLARAVRVRVVHAEWIPAAHGCRCDYTGDGPEPCDKPANWVRDPEDEEDNNGASLYACNEHKAHLEAAD